MFVHGFTGHPEDTWKLKRTKAQRTSHGKKRRRDEQPPDLPLRLKIKKLAFGASSPTPPTVQSSSAPPTSSHAPTANDSQFGISGEAESKVELPSDVYWPADLAPMAAPDSRIFTYGYDTKVPHRAVRQGSKNTVRDHAWDLLTTLELLRRAPSEERRPVLFVAHSLGGIVVKDALRAS